MVWAVGAAWRFTSATPSALTLGFFRQNLVCEYPYERSVVEGVNVVPVEAALCDEHASVSLDWIQGESAPRAFGRGEILQREREERSVRRDRDEPELPARGRERELDIER